MVSGCQFRNSCKALIQGDINHIGVGIEVNVFSLYYCIPVELIVSRLGVLPHLVPENFLVEWERVQVWNFLLPVFKIILVWTHRQSFISLGIKRIQVFAADWPATFGHPVPVYKIDRIKGRAHASPVPCGSSKIMEPGRHKGVVLLSGGFPFIQFLDLRFVFEPPSFQQDDFIRAVFPVKGHGDPCRSRADNTYISLD